MFYQRPIFAEILNFDFGPFSSFVNSLFASIWAALVGVLQGLFDFFANFLVWLNNALLSVVAAVLAILPDPPFTFWDAVANILQAYPSVPWGLFAPHVIVIAALLAIRMTVGSVRFFIKGWL